MKKDEMEIQNISRSALTKVDETMTTL